MSPEEINCDSTLNAPIGRHNHHAYGLSTAIKMTLATYFWWATRRIGALRSRLY